MRYVEGSRASKQAAIDRAEKIERSIRGPLGSPGSDYITILGALEGHHSEIGRVLTATARLWSLKRTQ